jgi:hypothetical protein
MRNARNAEPKTFVYVVAWLDDKPKVQHACESEAVAIDQVGYMRRHPRGHEYVFVAQPNMTREQMEKMTSPPKNAKTLAYGFQLAKMAIEQEAQASEAAKQKWEKRRATA